MHRRWTDEKYLEFIMDCSMWKAEQFRAWIMYGAPDGSTVEVLDLSRCPYEITPEFLTQICHLTQLQQLLLSKNKIRSLPVNIGDLTELTHLALDNNQIETLPVEIGKLHNLRNLDVRSNRLTTLPVEIGNLRSLQVLNVQSNRLATLPYEIGNLNKLVYLVVNDNYILTIPDGIALLPRLFELHCNQNCLVSFPSEFRNPEIQIYLDPYMHTIINKSLVVTFGKDDDTNPVRIGIRNANLNDTKPARMID
jgi:Leucine-rich repeat (LRR) protein